MDLPGRKPSVTWDDFSKIDMRVGVVLNAEPLRGAKIPAIAMKIDFGPLGVLRSSARLTTRYKPEQLVGKRVVGVVNFPPRRIAGFKSEVLVMGAIVPVDDLRKGADVSLIAIDHDDVAPGSPVA